MDSLGWLIPYNTQGRLTQGMGHVRLCSLEINSLGVPTSTSNGCRSPEACRAPDSQHHQEQCRDGVDLILTVAIPQYNSGVINPSLLLPSEVQRHRWEICTPKELHTTILFIVP